MSDHDPKAAGEFIASAVRIDDEAVLRCVGEFDVDAVRKFNAEFRACIAQGPKAVHVDCSRVTFTDSSALHAMINAVRDCRERGIEIHFSLSDHAMHVADVAGVLDLLVQRIPPD